ncbi:hypothetical protein K488DRAFT_73381 [Vararia minispora EC-137]|uniref:Uncharacterized protein n=1 Tax=Vararia minispora EC-137 TaxID=1314806 RepID=A0ACB8QAT9_9AGAM|nr:hypothetical protein K488DRAFT_73381 [Vararia minispora EC-137]
MAQAVFNDHPLDSYLQQTGELSEPMPGALPDLLGTEDDGPVDDDEDVPISLDDILGQLPAPLLQLLHAILSSFSPEVAQEREFSERFKYDIISSSSLLSASISPPTSAAPSRSFNLDQEAVNAASLAVEHPPNHAHSSGRIVDRMRPTLGALNELITAGNLWESTIHEAYAHIENEENSLYHASPTTLSAPSSALRVALLSALQTTQSQCDNVRQLLSALTAPAALAQLSEMYAPPSPARPAIALAMETTRPRTLPARQRTPSVPAHDKRSTWSGGGGLSYSALASAGSPSRRVLRHHEKRRSDLSALLEGSKSTSASAPATPDLPEVQEEDTAVERLGQTITVPSDDDPSFGSTALHLRRDRLRSGMNALGFPVSAPGSPPRSPPSTSSLRHSRSLGHSPRSASSVSSSRFTSMHTTRHPLSLSALNHSLTGALAAKRYAAAHLLALRFEEEEDDQYWEDVREVMELLTSALADAAARLSVSLEEAEQHHLIEQNPTPISSRRSSAQIPQKHAQSFAPMPTQFSRFAAHVEAMTSALADARENLEACVSALRAETPTTDTSLYAVAENPAVQAYERLRRELGLALRECERGRERLLDLVAPPAPTPNSESDDEADIPALLHDVSDESDKGHGIAPVSPEAASPVLADAVLVHAPPPTTDAMTEGLEALLADRLPPQGIEQVFEAEPEAMTSFVRERAKLPREERIRQARAKREAAGLGLTLGSVTEAPRKGLGLGGPERWGPSGEVVDELKDVIWKVGERRRRMAEAAAQRPEAASEA